MRDARHAQNIGLFILNCSSNFSSDSRSMIIYNESLSERIRDLCWIPKNHSMLKFGRCRKSLMVLILLFTSCVLKARNSGLGISLFIQDPLLTSLFYK